MLYSGIDHHKAEHGDLAHAKYLKAIRYAKVKANAVDAATMAQLLRVQLIPEPHMIRDGHREVRDVLRAQLLLDTRMLQMPRHRHDGRLHAAVGDRRYRATTP